MVSGDLVVCTCLLTANEPGKGGLAPYLMHSKHAHAALPRCQQEAPTRGPRTG